VKKSNTGKQVEIGPHNIQAQRQCQAVPAHASCGSAKAEYATCNDLTRRGGSLLVVDNRRGC
jgi:hypothetical protein